MASWKQFAAYNPFNRPSPARAHPCAGVRWVPRPPWDTRMTRLELRTLAHRVMRRYDVWEEFCHWSQVWWMMPEVAYRLARCVPTVIPSTSGHAPLLADCYSDAAVELRRWPESTSTSILNADALRAMLARALDAASHEVVLPNASPWRPAIDGPLADCLAAAGAGKVTLRPRADIRPAREAMHRLLERHVYCSRCALNLQQSYAQLMAIHGAPARRLWLV